MLKSTQANWILLLVTIIWGATFPLIYIAVHYINASAFVWLRFSMSAAILLPFAIKHFRYTDKKIFYLCILLGLTNCITYALQTIGLQYIEPTQSAFITGLNVVIVPFIAPFFRLGKARILDIACALLCALGLYFLTGANLQHISYGEIITLGNAVAYAFSIVLLQIISKKTSHYGLVTFYQVSFTALFIMPFAYQQSYQHLLMPEVLLPLLFCAILATVLVLFLQVRYQQYTSANKAALIYSLEPVFASVISYFLVHTHFNNMMLTGAALMMLGILLSDIVGFIKNKKTEQLR
jgi:drug/metabolite transporter (DMT)-like permease